MGARGTIVERFWSKVNKAGPLRKGMKTRCWEWTAGRAIKGQYGIIATQTGSPPKLAHRLSWEIHYGEIPDGTQVCHKCDNGLCVRPTHFFAGTMSDNMRDRTAKGRTKNGAKTHPEKMKRGEEHGMAKLTEESVREMRALYASGHWMQIELAEKYGVSQSRVSTIMSRKQWRHV